MNDPQKKTLSVVIPVYNEAQTIETVISKVKEALKKQNIDGEIIVVNDGSGDESAAIIKKIPDIVFINLEKNSGKGGALKAGFKAATTDILFIQDADLEYDPEDYSAMIAPILKGETEFVMGSRFLKEVPKFFGKNKSPYLTHFIGNQMIILLTNFLYMNNATDYEGCYKAFTRRILEEIPVRSNGFEYDNELICKILKKKYKIIEVPIAYNPRSYESGKKITWMHGMKMLWAIVKFRFIN